MATLISTTYQAGWTAESCYLYEKLFRVSSRDVDAHDWYEKHSFYQNFPFGHVISNRTTFSNAGEKMEITTEKYYSKDCLMFETVWYLAGMVKINYYQPLQDVQQFMCQEVAKNVNIHEKRERK